jgi:hypothetical protein
MAMQWSTTNEASAAQGVKMLCYADSGQGKTVLCATAPKPVVISAEAGLLSLRKKNLEKLFGVNTPGIAYDIPVLQVTTVVQLTEVFNFFAAPANRAREHFNTICIDSLTEIAEVVLTNAKGIVKDPRQAYGELLDKMEMVIRQFRDLPGYHVYMSAKMEPVKDEVNGTLKYWPSMPGSKLGPRLPYYFDEVFNLNTGKTPQGQKYRFLRTDSDMQYIAKDRSGALDEIEQPNLTNVINKILGA